MSDPITPVQSVESEPVGDYAPTPTTGTDPGYNMQTTISNVDELRKKAPKVYKAMLEGVAMNICNKMKRHQDNLKRLMREWRRRAGIR